MNARNFHSGMGKAVAERTILRKIPKNKTLTHIDVAINDPVHDDMKNYASVNGLTFNVHDADSITPIEWEWEDWGDVAQRVAQGNTSLVEGCGDYDELRDHIGNATILMSGRHLQHGDASQSKRNLEVFSNCSTAPASFLLFYLLLNGSGVGRSYDDDLMLVNWDHSPTVRCVLDSTHPDYDYVRDESLRDAQHKYGNGSNVHWFKVPDSREGWAQAVELYETMTFQKAFRDHLLILDFSDVREKGAAIGGMQGRPSSGPIPLMQALHKIGTLKGAGLAAWMQAMYVDHYLAEPVLVGGARRAARMAVKYWKDRTVIDFIHVKRPIEFKGKNYEEVQALRGPMAFLWSSNNSIGVDAEFWTRLDYGPEHQHYNAELTRHARRVFEEATGCAYGDGTGEPGFINLDELVENQSGDVNTVEVGSARYQIMDETHFLLSGVAKKHASKKYKMIVNPCVTGDTVIATVAGPRTFASLAETEQDVLVYAWHPDTKLPVVRWMRRPHKTGVQSEILEVEFDSGLKVRMTPNHSLYTFRGNKVQARDLRIGQSIRAFSMSEHRDGQLRVHAWDAESNSAKHQWVHRMVWEQANGPVPEGMIIHHIDHDPKHNEASNLEALTITEHNQEHYPNRFANGFDGTCKNHKVVSVTIAGYEDVYNGCVDDAHTYIIVDPQPVAGIMSGIVSANCGEITLSQKGAYCVIADTVPYHADTLVEAQRAFELSARALIRVNTMDSLYNFEVKRTNRIGVGITGVHEFAWKFFKVGFGHMVKPDFEGYVKLDVGGMDLTHLDVVQTLRYHTDPYVRAAAFWECLGAFSRASMRSAFAYADELGVARPHTVTTIKPAGTTSKLFGLTEGWHLSPLAYYMRYVQFREDDPLIDDYERNGYEVRSLETYRGHRIVGFPTEPVIASMGMGDDLVLAGDASPTDQYTWIKLGEFFWIEGGTAAEYAAGKAARDGECRYGNQISYTLKYKPDVTSLDEFRRVLRENQSKVRCASVMPQADTSAYEYLPETAISKGEYEYWVQAIQLAMSEDIDAATMQCAGGACPVDIK